MGGSSSRESPVVERQVHKSELVSMFTASLFGNIAKCERKAYISRLIFRIWKNAQIRWSRSPSWPFPGYSAHIGHISSLHRGWPYHHRMWYLETFEPNFQNNGETLHFQQISSNIWLKKEFWPQHRDNDLLYQTLSISLNVSHIVVRPVAEGSWR